ncbi:S-layer homology domain-containing protein [Paenibacillus sophorae]|uniref:S-layer homology domain-containing protein n=1 Tax=Paenibacillus sophorae TaxID=1333845 RepID=A0A1H8QH40_9BACL|nr:S-layer homology domain-containing protein [Paenibacillus sophorae]QWU15133.1 S-layer homology domain-containing protein [Paenibacillus sophorae]SEO53224.1 S-layer homology domain-containing protein [Paenibacillus sophorae]
MTLKKKLAVSTLAVSMAAASVAGLPLSGKGLAQQLGFVNVASAATTVTNADVKAKLIKLFANLQPADWSKLEAFYTEVNGLSQPKYEQIFAPILGKLQLNEPQTTTSYKLYQSATSVVYDVYQGDFAAIGRIQTNADYAKLLDDIAVKAKVDHLNTNDFVEFFFGTSGIEAELRTLLAGKTQSELNAIINDPSSSEAIFEQAYNNVLNPTTGTQKATTVSQAVYGLGITSTDVKSALYNLNVALPSAKPAEQVLAQAYIRAFGLGIADGTSGGNGGGFGGTTPPTTPSTDLSVFDASKLVTVINGKATVALVDADVIKAIQALAAAKAGTTLTLNLGTVNAATVEVSLSKAIIDAAKANGIVNIAITFNGVTITIPVSQFDAAVTLTVTKADPSVATSVTSLKLASDVYEFGLTVGGVSTTTFKQPITIKLPLKNTDGLDKELLSVTKIVYGNLQFQGGVLDGEFIVEPRDTFSSYVVVENKVSFNDIASVQTWAGRQIQVVAAKGAIEGVGAGKFFPKNNVTRAEFAKMLIRALNLENSTAVSSFGDVKKTDWFAQYVAVAAEKGIINGRSASKFDPNATITRAEMATMISRALKSVHNLKDGEASATALGAFSDAAKINPSLKEGVTFAASKGLIIGNAGKFNPNNTATRAEAAVIIYRTINFK